MSMKKTDLEKLKAKKLSRDNATPDRFGKGSAAHGKSRHGKAAGVPLALKLLGTRKDDAKQ